MNKYVENGFRQLEEFHNKCYDSIPFIDDVDLAIKAIYEVIGENNLYFIDVCNRDVVENEINIFFSSKPLADRYIFINYYGKNLFKVQETFVTDLQQHTADKLNNVYERMKREIYQNILDNLK